MLATRGLLAPDTWKCKRAQVSLKATIDVPMLGTIIEQNGDGLLEDSHMPVGWPLHIDGAVRQCCIHRSASQQELDDMLKEYDMKRDSVEINHDAPQWSHNAVWNRRYMEPKTGYTLQQLWADSEPAIGKKSSPSYEIKESDILRAVAAIANLPSPTLPDSPFIRALGTPAAHKASPQTDTLAQRALEEWERTLCENKAVAIVAEVQAGRPALIQKDGGEMLIAIVLDKPLAEAKALVDDPAAFTREMTRIHKTNATPTEPSGRLLRTPLKLHAPAFLASLLPLLPSRTSALSLFAGLRLPSSPRALVFVLVCPPRCPFSWFGSPLSQFWFGLLAWSVFCLVWFVGCFFVLFVFLSVL